MDLLKGKKNMVWAYMGNTRMYTALRDYGDRLDTVGVFAFKVKETGEIYESGVSISTMLTYINKWPHIKWLLTIGNDGTTSIFTALRNNTDGARDKFLSELIRIMQEYPWCSGVDIDLERGGGYENKDAANTLFQKIYETVKAYDSTKLVNVCLPGMTSVQGSVGGENWCVYADLAPYCDTMAIMSYGEAWAGSAPGPTSSSEWLIKIYDYATAVVPPEKIFMGLPGYGWEWQLYDTPENLGKTYRAISLTYYGARGNMLGEYRYADSQAYIPFFSYWDDNNKVPWGLLYVYDYMEGPDAVSYSYPLMPDTYKSRRYLTAYSKHNKTEIDGVIAYRPGNGTSFAMYQNGSFTRFDDGYITVSGDAVAYYNFDVSTAGTYDIAVAICFPFWGKTGIYIAIDSDDETIEKYFTESRLWWPYWRTTFWSPLVKGIYLSKGTHTLKVHGGSGCDSDVQFRGFYVCSSFSAETTAGEAEYTLSPRQFKDVNGNMVGPATGFKLTMEVLRREADSALIWYDDFRDGLPDNYWRTLSGSWKVWRSDEYSSERVYSQLEGSGLLTWQYDEFSDIHLRARLAFPAGSGGRAGVFCGSLFCCLNYDSQAVELYNDSTLLGSYDTPISQTAESVLRSDPDMYTIEMRIRGDKVRVYSGASHTLRIIATIPPTTGLPWESTGFSGGYAGYRSDNRTVCDLLRLGDAWTYEPYERFDVEMPDGSYKSYGRIERSDCVWDEEFQVFTLTSDVEESATRNEDISLDYDFFHSDIMTSVKCENDYTIKIIPKDINIWISRLFLGDADGFAIQYYQDADSILYWTDQAAYHWRMRGFALWSLGQEDMRLWKYLPKQIT